MDRSKASRIIHGESFPSTTLCHRRMEHLNSRISSHHLTMGVIQVTVLEPMEASKQHQDTFRVYPETQQQEADMKNTNVTH
ncbi:unnamed protein product [Lathyrus oleraceus]